jgi:hypothetical protein
MSDEVRSIRQQLRNQRRVRVKILARADCLSTAVPGSVHDLHGESIRERELPAPTQLARNCGAMQQHYPRSAANSLHEQNCANAREPTSRRLTPSLVDFRLAT